MADEDVEQGTARVIGAPAALGGQQSAGGLDRRVDAERRRGLKPSVPRDQHAVLIDQQRVGESEGQHAGLDLLQLRGAVDASIAGVRPQLRHRTQQDLRRHPGERHRAIQIWERVQTMRPRLQTQRGMVCGLSV